MRTVRFENFGMDDQNGRMVSHDGSTAVVSARNPYGCHNLTVIEDRGGYWAAIAHGNLSSLIHLAFFHGNDSHVYRQARKHLAARGKLLDVVFEDAKD